MCGFYCTNIRESAIVIRFYRLTEVTESSGIAGRTYALKFIRNDGIIRSTHSSIVAVVHTTRT